MNPGYRPFALLGGALLLILQAAPLRPVGGPAPAHPSLRSIQLERVLPGPGAQAMLQDRLGRLWVGTSQGLACFNGWQWQLLPVGPGGGTPSVRSLLEDREGNLWVGTDTEGIWRYRKGQWVQYREGFLAKQSSGRVQTMLEAPDAPGGPMLLFGTDQGIVRYQNGRWSLMGKEEGLPDPMVWKLGVIHEPDQRVRVWAATSGGLVRLENGRWQRVDPPQGSVDAADFLSLEVAPGRWQVWVSIWNQGVACWDGREWHTYGPPQGFPGRNPTCLAVTRSPAGKPVLWAGTYDGGLAWFDGTWHPLGIREGFPAPGVLSMHPLPGGKPALLVGTRASGVLAVDPGSWTPLRVRQGLPDDQVTCFAEWPNAAPGGTLWIGTAGGLAALDQATGTLRQVAGVGSGPYCQTLLSALEPKKGPGLWVATLTDLLKFDGQRWHPFGKTTGLPEGSAALLAESFDQQGRPLLWASHPKGLARWDGARWQMEPSPEGFSGRINAIIATRNPGGGDSVWVARQEHGVQRLRDGNWRTYGTQDGLPERSVSCLLPTVDSGGKSWLWAGTANGGVACLSLDRPDDSWHPCSWKELATVGPSPIRGLTVDRHDRLYVLAAPGVWRITFDAKIHPPRPLRLESFTVGDGLPSAICTDTWTDSRGRVWVGSPQGAAVLDPREETFAPPLPAPVVLRVERVDDGLPVRPGETLPPQRNHLAFEFGLPVHHRFEDTRYRSQLVDQEQLGPWRREGFRELSGLGPGRYTLRVWTRDFLGRVGEPSEFSWRIAPPVWSSLWFRALALALFAGMLMLLFRLRTHLLVRSNRELEIQVRARTRELETANRALAEKNLLDPLTSLHNRRFVDESVGRDVALVTRQYWPGRSGAEDQNDPRRALVFYMVDLDHFKPINDHYGHHTGDTVLLRIAQILSAAVRETDSVVRWGGEEFLLIARDINLLEAPVMAERIRSQVEREVFETPSGQVIPLTCSIGFAAFPLFPQDPERLSWEWVIELADECMYQAKRAGRNRWAGLLPADPAPRDLGRLPPQPHARELLEGGLARGVESGSCVRKPA